MLSINVENLSPSNLNDWVFPLFTIGISIIAAIISYYNYTLNKTLNIKNQLFNEKLKKYIELSRKVAEFIELLDIIGLTFNRSQSDKKKLVTLSELSEKAVYAGLSIQYLIIESHMLVPKRIITQMTNFAEYQNLGLPHDLIKATHSEYWDAHNNIRERAENLIKAFREDLSVDKLSIKISKPKSPK